MTENEYKDFVGWSRDMRYNMERSLEIAKERASAQIIALNMFENFIAAMRQASEREENRGSRDEHTRNKDS